MYVKIFLQKCTYLQIFKLISSCNDRSHLQIIYLIFRDSLDDTYHNYEHKQINYFEICRYIILHACNLLTFIIIHEQYLYFSFFSCFITKYKQPYKIVKLCIYTHILLHIYFATINDTYSNIPGLAWVVHVI